MASRLCSLSSTKTAIASSTQLPSAKTKSVDRMSKVFITEDDRPLMKEPPSFFNLSCTQTAMLKRHGRVGILHRPSLQLQAQGTSVTHFGFCLDRICSHANIVSGPVQSLR